MLKKLFETKDLRVGDIAVLALPTPTYDNREIGTKRKYHDNCVFSLCSNHKESLISLHEVTIDAVGAKYVTVSLVSHKDRKGNDVRDLACVLQDEKTCYCVKNNHYTSTIYTNTHKHKAHSCIETRYLQRKKGLQFSVEAIKASFESAKNNTNFKSSDPIFTDLEFNDFFPFIKGDLETVLQRDGLVMGDMECKCEEGKCHLEKNKQGFNIILEIFKAYV